MTSPASSTAVFSRLPMPKSRPRSSPSERAGGPAESSLSRGRSSGGSCLMVYRQRPGVSTSVPTHPVALQHAAGERERETDHVRVIALDPRYKERRFPLYGVPSGLTDTLPEPDVGG